jgi:peptidoglycan/xylan/chitin deacetylase (PgdA/CDA1 family)
MPAGADVARPAGRRLARVGSEVPAWLTAAGRFARLTVWGSVPRRLMGDERVRTAGGRARALLARGSASLMTMPGRVAALAIVVLVLAAGSAYSQPARGHWLTPTAATNGISASASPTAVVQAAPPSVATQPSNGLPESGGRSGLGPGGSRSATSPGPASGVGPGGATRSTGGSTVALTFDDGPDPVNTPHILDLLAQRGVKATFCLVGWRARDNPDLVRRIVTEGHTLCNHSWQHFTDLAQRPVSYIRWDLAETNRAIRNAVPGAKISYFRAPGGNFSSGLVAMAREYGMTSIYWDVDPRDWDHAPDRSDQMHVQRVIGEVQRNTRAGSIVLSHDNRQPDTITAYQTLLPWLSARFTLVALPA